MIPRATPSGSSQDHIRPRDHIPRDHLILPRVVADSQSPTIPTPKSAHLIYTSAALILMGLYREIC